MILPEYLEKEVRKFCKINNIPIKNSIVLSEHRAKIQDFVQQRLKLDRFKTMLQEEDKKLHIKYIMSKMLTGKEPEITIENYMKDALVKAKLYKHCRQQFQIGTKRVDFAFPIAHLAVECDGREYHHTESWQLERDQKRDKYLAHKGWRVLHIEGLAIRRNIGLCVEKIRKALEPFIKQSGIGE